MKTRGVPSSDRLYLHGEGMAWARNAALAFGLGILALDLTASFDPPGWIDASPVVKHNLTSAFRLRMVVGALLLTQFADVWHLWRRRRWWRQRWL